MATEKGHSRKRTAPVNYGHFSVYRGCPLTGASSVPGRESTTEAKSDLDSRTNFSRKAK